MTKQQLVNGWRLLDVKEMKPNLRWQRVESANLILWKFEEEGGVDGRGVGRRVRVRKFYLLEVWLRVGGGVGGWGRSRRVNRHEIEAPSFCAPRPPPPLSISWRPCPCLRDAPAHTLSSPHPSSPQCSFVASPPHPSSPLFTPSPLCRCSVVASNKSICWTFNELCSIKSSHLSLWSTIWAQEECLSNVKSENPLTRCWRAAPPPSSRRDWSSILKPSSGD